MLQPKAILHSEVLRSTKLALVQYAFKNQRPVSKVLDSVLLAGLQALDPSFTAEREAEIQSPSLAER